MQQGGDDKKSGGGSAGGTPGKSSSSPDGKKTYLQRELTLLDESWDTLIEDQSSCERAALRLFEKIGSCIAFSMQKFDEKFQFTEESAERRVCFTKLSSLEHKQKLLQYQMDLIKAGKPFESEDNTPRRKELTEKEAGVSTRFAYTQFNVGSEYLNHCINAADELIAEVKSELHSNLARIKKEIDKTVQTCYENLDSGVGLGSIFTGGKIAESKEKRNLYVKLEQFVGRAQSLELINKTLV